MIACTAERETGVINAPHTLYGDFGGEVPVANASSADTFSDAEVERLVKKSPSFSQLVHDAATGCKLAGVVYADPPSRMVSRIVAAKIQEETRKEREKQQEKELEKARKMAEEIRRMKAALSPYGEENTFSELDVFLRGGMSFEELFLSIKAKVMKAPDMSCADHFSNTVPVPTPKYGHFYLGHDPPP